MDKRITDEQKTDPIRELIAKNLDKYVDMGPGYHAGDGGIFYPEGVTELPRLKTLTNALEEFIRRFDSPDQLTYQDYTEFIENLNNVLRDDNIQIGIVDDNPNRLRRNIPEQNFQFNDGNLIFPTMHLRSGEVGKLSRYEGLVIKDEINGKTVKFLKFTKDRLHQVGWVSGNYLYSNPLAAIATIFHEIGHGYEVLENKFTHNGETVAPITEVVSTKFGMRALEVLGSHFGLNEELRRKYADQLAIHNFSMYGNVLGKANN